MCTKSSVRHGVDAMQVSPGSVSVLWVTYILALSWHSNVVHASRREREGTIKDLLNHSIYDKRIPPDFEEDYPTEVTIQIVVLSIDSVTEASMDYSATIFLHEHWLDKRLKWGDVGTLPRDSSSHSRQKHASTSGTTFTGRYANNTTTRSTDDDNEDVTRAGNNEDNTDDSMSGGNGAAGEDLEVLERFEVGPKLMEEVWVPDLYFVNDKEAKIHDVTMANRMLHIYRNGTIHTSTRISLTLSCNMHLERYPHDQQTCSIFLGSYSYSNENVKFRWHDKPVILKRGVTLARFLVHFSHAGHCSFDVDQGSLIHGNYTCISADFTLVRQFGYYMAQVYVPSVLIVTLSWVSFWIDFDATPARVSLGLLTVLTMTTQSTGEKSSLPKVSYVKAIDVWMAGCLVFVFAALLEFAYVNVQSRVEKRRQESTGEPRVGFDIPDGAADTGTTTMTTAAKRSANRGSSPSQPPLEPLAERQATLSRRPHFMRDLRGMERARMADKIARVTFPVAFAIFNVIYWVIFARL